MDDGRVHESERARFVFGTMLNTAVMLEEQSLKTPNRRWLKTVTGIVLLVVSLPVILLVGVLVGAVVELVLPREGTAERLTEVLRQQAGQMKRHPEQVGRGGRHRPSQLVLREALELVQDTVVEPVETSDELGLHVRCRRPLGRRGEASVPGRPGPRVISLGPGRP